MEKQSAAGENEVSERAGRKVVLSKKFAFCIVDRDRDLDLYDGQEPLSINLVAARPQSGAALSRRIFGPALYSNRRTPRLMAIALPTRSIANITAAANTTGVPIPPGNAKPCASANTAI